MLQLRPAKFVLTAALTGLAVFLAIAYYNYRADRWGVYASDYRSFHEKIFINKLYLKSRYLLHTEHDFDCFLFGSSRLAAIDARHFGDTCYNFTHSGGLVADHVTAVKVLLDRGVPVRRVYIALDDLSYNENPEEGAFQHMRRAYPRSFLDYIGFNKLFMLKAPDFTDLALVTGARPKLDTPRFIVDPNLDTDRIRERYQRYFEDPHRNDARFRRLQGMAEGDIYHGDASVAALEELQALAVEHDFEVELFFLPLHYKTYLKRNYDWFSRFRHDVAALQAYHDYSGLHRYSIDNRYWRETSHFSADVGDEIALGVLEPAQQADPVWRFIDESNAITRDNEQIERDAKFLPLLAHREGVLAIPERFTELWRELGSLEDAGVEVPASANRAFFDPAAAQRFDLGREDGGEARTALVTLDVRQGEFFLISYDFDSAYPEVMNWQVTQDAQLYGEPRKQFKLRVLPGENRGGYLGYASVDRPQVRLNLGGGNLNYDWRGLSVYRLSLDASSQSTMTEFAKLY